MVVCLFIELKGLNPPKCNSNRSSRRRLVYSYALPHMLSRLFARFHLFTYNFCQTFQIMFCFVTHIVCVCFRSVFVCTMFCAVFWLLFSTLEAPRHRGHLLTTSIGRKNQVMYRLVSAHFNQHFERSFLIG